MAFQKTITEAVAVAGLHTLTVSDVANLIVGYSIDVQGIGNTFNGTHTISAIDEEDSTVSFQQGNHNHALADVFGLLTVNIEWITPEDVELFLGIGTPSQDEADYLDVCTTAASEWAFRRRQSSGYVDYANMIPGSDVKLGTTILAGSYFREKGSVDSFASFDTMATIAPIGNYAQIMKLLGIQTPLGIF